LLLEMVLFSAIPGRMLHPLFLMLPYILENKFSFHDEVDLGYVFCLHTADLETWIIV